MYHACDALRVFVNDARNVLCVDKFLPLVVGFRLCGLIDAAERHITDCLCRRENRRALFRCRLSTVHKIVKGFLCRRYILFVKDEPREVHLRRRDGAHRGTTERRTRLDDLRRV